jgi:hypothetical protein
MTATTFDLPWLASELTLITSEHPEIERAYVAQLLAHLHQPALVLACGSSHVEWYCRILAHHSNVAWRLLADVHEPMTTDQLNTVQESLKFFKREGAGLVVTKRPGLYKTPLDWSSTFGKVCELLNMEPAVLVVEAAEFIGFQSDPQRIVAELTETAVDHDMGVLLLTRPEAQFVGCRYQVAIDASDARTTDERHVEHGFVRVQDNGQQAKPYPCDHAHRAGLKPDGRAVCLHVAFRFSRPKSHFGTGKNAKAIKASAPSNHVSRPDIDKLLRAVLDGLTGVAYQDDSFVYKVSAEKSYCDELDDGPSTTIWVS